MSQQLALVLCLAMPMAGCSDESDTGGTTGTRTGGGGMASGGDGGASSGSGDGGGLTGASNGGSGLGGGGGGGLASGSSAVSVSTVWRLWSNTGVTYSEHLVEGPSGERDNVVECSVSGDVVQIGLVDEGLDEFDQIARRRSVLEMQLDRTNPDVCSVQVNELPLGSTSGSTPNYRDSCGADGGCEVMLEVDGGGLSGGVEVSGTLRCTDMRENTATTPLELAGPLGSGATREPLQFHLTGCSAR